MHENITDFLFQTLLIVVFIAAIGLFLVINQTVFSSIDTVKANYINNPLVIEGSNHIKDEKVYKGHEIIAKIFLGLDYDIDVDGRLINADDEIESIDLTIIEANGSYSYDLILDMNGQIANIIYRKQ